MSVRSAGLEGSGGGTPEKRKRLSIRTHGSVTARSETWSLGLNQSAAWFQRSTLRFCHKKTQKFSLSLKKKLGPETAKEERRMLFVKR